MLKDKLANVRDFIVKHCKIVFPVLVIAVVAITVVIALNLNQEKASAEEKNDGEEYMVFGDMGGEPIQVEAPTDVPLVVNEDSAIFSLVATYYNAWGTGDMETLASVYDNISENDLLQYQETARYLDHYTELQVYTKQGPVEGSSIAYVYYRVWFVDHEEEFPGYETLYICMDEQGQLYIKNEANFTQEENDYIMAVSTQDDVIEFNNRVTAEYNALMMEDSSLLTYLNEVGHQVEVAMGVALARQNVGGVQETDVQEGEGEPQEGSAPEPQEPVQEATPEYATTTATVNVRNSDSVQADKLGKAPQGTRLQVKEVRINGWTKVVFEGKDGFIKSEYLRFSESVSNQEVIGTVTATTRVNIRAAANESADRLGQLADGESLNLLAVENGWCKVVYNNQIAYVKADYVEQH